MTLEEHRGIYPVFEIFYLQSILYSADRSAHAFRNFDKAVSQHLAPDFIFAAVQEALTYAGALSRFFWPMKADKKLAFRRGARLRQAFELDDTSPLKWRRLRNAFEHFDEDLDQFLLEDRAGYFFPSPIIGDHHLADDDLGHIFKLVDPSGGVCVLLGNKFEFRPIQAEVERILVSVIQKYSAGGRL